MNKSLALSFLLSLIIISVVDGVPDVLVSGHILISSRFLQDHWFNLPRSIHVNAALALREGRPCDATVLPDESGRLREI